MGRWMGVTHLQAQVQQVAQGQAPLHSHLGAFDGGDCPAALTCIKGI
jgi:hypothetical protein